MLFYPKYSQLLLPPPCNSPNHTALIKLFKLQARLVLPLLQGPSPRMGAQGGEGEAAGGEGEALEAGSIVLGWSKPGMGWDPTGCFK